MTVTKDSYTYRVTKKGLADKRYKYQPKLKGVKPTIKLRQEKFWDFQRKLMAVAIGIALLGMICLMLEDYFHEELISPFVEAKTTIEVMEDRVPQYCEDYPDFCLYTWNPKKMIAIAKCESRMDSEAFAHEPNGSYSIGLLQVNSIHGFKPSELFDSFLNVQKGYLVWESQGYEAWTVYESLCYYKELSEL